MSDAPEQPKTPSQDIQPSGGGSPKEVEEGKIMAVLAYLLWPVPFFMARDNSYVLFHVRQAALLVGAAIAVVLIQILAGVIGGFLYRALACVGGILSVGILVFAVIGVINAVQGSEKKLPFIGDYAEKLPF